MENFGQKIGLIQKFETTLIISEEQFVNRFRLHYEKKQTNIFSRFLESIRLKSKPIYGEIIDHKFTLTQDNIGVNSQIGKVVVNGEYIVDGEKIRIWGEVSSFNRQMKLIFSGLTIIYASFLIAFLVPATNTQKSDFPMHFAFPFLLLHGLFMYGIFYRMSLSAAKTMKNNLIKELYYLTKNE